MSHNWVTLKSGEMLIKYSYESLVDIVSIDWKTN